MAQPLEKQTVSEDRPLQLQRGFSFRSALSLAFADVSPIAAVYAIFSLGLFAAGPKFFWAFPIVLIGQLLVAAVFGEFRHPDGRTQAASTSGRDMSAAPPGAGRPRGRTCGASPWPSARCLRR